MVKSRNYSSNEQEQEEEIIPKSSAMTIALSPPIWPMVSISQQKIIFPPSNHENLSISQSDSLSDSFSDSGSISDSDSSFSPSAASDSPDIYFKPTPIVNEHVSSLSWIIINTLCSKLYSFVRYMWNCFGFSRNAGWFRIAFVVLCFLYFRQRKRLRDGETNKHLLIRVIEEKEEKINRLLDQVSRMNQVLLGLHKVPTSS